MPFDRKAYQKQYRIDHRPENAERMRLHRRVQKLMLAIEVLQARVARLERRIAP